VKQRWYFLAAALMVFAATPAAAQNGAKVSLLSCRMAPSVGLLVGSRQHLQCNFTPDQGGAPGPIPAPSPAWAFMSV
jgi:hypothetical protein